MIDPQQLQPATVWRHFLNICRIPRPSRHEQGVRDYVLAFAAEHGIAATSDAAGNLILRKPATPGREDRPCVVLQGHMDMVCQKRHGSPHDFLRDPIVPRLADGWLIADDTTLGADNGLGMAMALSVLEAGDMAHGPLEVLLTVDEETGMSGAQGLAPGLLQAELLINIDTEDWGEFYLGCAGGVDVNLHHRFTLAPSPDNGEVVRISVGGLHGGHSGVDIHLERGNAIKLLVRVLAALQCVPGFRIARISGGSARNALPRDAEATVVIAPGSHAALEACVQQCEATFRDELGGVDEGVSVACDRLDEVLPATPSALDQGRLIALLLAAPHGVRRMSRRVPGVVETSNNFGVLNLQHGELNANFMVRSLLASGTRQLATEIEALCALAGMEVALDGAYPGWSPDPGSRLLAHFQQVYRREFGASAAVKVIHAGLECGILAAKYPAMDMISFGPDIRGAHAPGERVRVASVAQAWQLLGSVLAALPPREAWLSGNNAAKDGERAQ
jgi:dipeptidase D